MAKHAEGVVMLKVCIVAIQCVRYYYPSSAMEASTFKALLRGLCGKDMHAAWHLACCVLDPGQPQRMTVQQALDAGFL